MVEAGIGDSSLSVSTFSENALVHAANDILDGSLQSLPQQFAVIGPWRQLTDTTSQILLLQLLFELLDTFASELWQQSSTGIDLVRTIWEQR
jgi:hypothetical protein